MKQCIQTAHNLHKYNFPFGLVCFPYHINLFSPDGQKLNLTLASSNEGWDKAVNGQLLLEFASNSRVKVSGFVPKSTQQQREDAKKLGIELVDAKELPDHSPSDLLAYPPDSLKIDILMIHSYGRDVGRQAQVIKETKNCKWLHVLHTVSEELVKFAAEHESEHEVQLALCQEADIVIAIGPKVAEAYRSALGSSGKQKDVIDLTPGIFHNFIGVRLPQVDGETFRVLISGSSKYFKIKGCDIAAKAIKLLNTSSFHLVFVVKPTENAAEITQALLSEGIDSDQLTVKVSGSSEDWIKLLCEVDLAIKPSRTEGFGISGLRAISADLPVLVSGNIGLGFALKKLPSGANHVVESDDPQIWANKIKEVRAKDPKTRGSEAEALRKEYTGQFNWKDQCDKLVDKMFTMIPNKHGM